MGRNAELLARRTAAVARGVAVASPIFAARALNAELWDVEGRRYIDFAGGIGVLNTGHRHKRVMEAVAAQLEKFTHTSYQVVAYEPYVALAERLNALAPFKGPAKSLLFTTGAEAVENAIKIARGSTGRSAVISFTGAFHGRTMMTMALTGKVVPYKKNLGPPAPEVYHAPFPIAHYGTTTADSLKALEFLFKAAVDPARVAAIIIEPVQGEGGFHVAPGELLKELRAICSAHGIVFIVDEVQSGFGRTGKMFAIEHSGVEPDLVAVAKSLAGGFPLSAILGREGLMDALEPGALGGTYAGSPVSCVAALAVLDVFAEEKLLARSSAIGEQISARLAKIERKNGLLPIAHARGLGAMVAFDIVKSRGEHEPDGAAAKRVTVRALERGLILLLCGIYGETIRILVPLTVSDAVLGEGLDRLEDALEAT
jgi:4-aminobutyrate aminotransferase/(S)-3-amino-2-methylpropionate transaminase